MRLSRASRRFGCFEGIWPRASAPARCTRSSFWLNRSATWANWPRWGARIGTVSARLKLLLVARRREGKAAIYSIADAHVLHLVENAIAHICEDHRTERTKPCRTAPIAITRTTTTSMARAAAIPPCARAIMSTTCMTAICITRMVTLRQPRPAGSRHPLSRRMRPDAVPSVAIATCAAWPDPGPGLLPLIEALTARGSAPPASPGRATHGPSCKLASSCRFVPGTMLWRRRRSAAGSPGSRPPAAVSPMRRN